MTKALFLDFDGVLNGRVFLDTLPRTITLSARPDIDPMCAARVQRICDATGAHLVITSSWREMRAHDGRPDTCHAPRELSTLVGWLIDAGITAPILGATTVRTLAWDGKECRTKQIVEWLREHPDVVNWLVVDDYKLPELLAFRFVQTNEETGITDRDVERAISLLGPKT